MIPWESRTTSSGGLSPATAVPPPAGLVVAAVVGILGSIGRASAHSSTESASARQNTSRGPTAHRDAERKAARRRDAPQHRLYDWTMRPTPHRQGAAG